MLPSGVCALGHKGGMNNVTPCKNFLRHTHTRCYNHAHTERGFRV
jgi:hypothetical protein